MTPCSLMVLGALVSIASALHGTVSGPDYSSMLLMFGGGALFGKGYGVWEERAKGGDND